MNGVGHMLNADKATMTGSVLRMGARQHGARLDAIRRASRIRSRIENSLAARREKPRP